jgi:hypothetical protein
MDLARAPRSIAKNGRCESFQLNFIENKTLCGALTRWDYTTEGWFPLALLRFSYARTRTLNFESFYF